VFLKLWGSCCEAAVPDSWLLGSQQWARSWHSAPGWWWPALPTHLTEYAPSPPRDKKESNSNSSKDTQGHKTRVKSKFVQLSVSIVGSHFHSPSQDVLCVHTSCCVSSSWSMVMGWVTSTPSRVAHVSSNCVLLLQPKYRASRPSRWENVSINCDKLSA